jgi:hypothetical protein
MEIQSGNPLATFIVAFAVGTRDAVDKQKVITVVTLGNGAVELAL